MTSKNIEEIWDLTPLQQGMLFHTLYSTESSVYTIQLEMAVEGELDESAVENAWRSVVARHAPLRASFVWERLEKPYQVVHREVDLSFTRYDWAMFAATDQDERRRSFLAEDRARLFDLAQPPLMRVALIALAPRVYRLIWTFHHILLEGWSAAIVLNEMWKVYGDLRSGRSPALSPVVPYANYLQWLKRQDRNLTEAYWRKTLKDFDTPTHLPIDRSMQDAPADVKNIGRCDLACPETFAATLHGFCRAHRVTLNTAIQGAWAILLSRYSGNADVVFGVVVSGRSAELPGSASIVGQFVNTLPARVKVEEDERLVPWLRRLQLDQAEMRQYEHSSLVDVRRWSSVRGTRPLFDTALAFENWLGELPAGEVCAGLRIGNCQMHSMSDLPLTLVSNAFGARGLHLTLMYDTARFERADIERMLRNCRTLLEGIAANADAGIGELGLLTEAERGEVVERWNDTGTDYPRERSIKELFEEQARLHPQAVAVEQEGRRLTYRELNERANQLARHLRGWGVGPEVLVGICVERSLEMVVGILGIVKAGGAYVPLDPEYPQSRLSYMLRDTAAPVLLTQSRLRERLPAYAGRVLSLDGDWEALARGGREDVEVAVGPRHLAYVMYTSGSTGLPKGTCIEQRSVVRLVRETNYIELGPREVVLQYSPISFDASTLELWGALLNGGKLVVCPAGLLSLQELGRVIREGAVSTAWLTAALFNQMVDEQLDSLRGVRQLLAGGEALSVSHVRRMLEVIGEGRLINGYGPTENTTFTCCHVMRAGTRIEQTVPIGRPIANTRVYVLDERMRPVPVGVYGELYIGGDGLARAYLNREQLTAEKFVADPFSAEAGARLYRTGDLVRYREDGCIEFLGRVDHQVKIRGYRIEPGEIEATLGAHAGVREAVVLAREDEPGDKRLVAYVVAEAGTGVSAEGLRRHVRTTLPEYMIPGAFVFLESFPLTPNGKVDRAALPRPGATRSVDTAYVQPRTALERKIAAIWQEALHVGRVGMDDNFFDLGGNSMLLVRAYSKLQQEIGSDLRIVDLFRYPTVLLLAARVTDGGAAESWQYDRIREQARRRREVLTMQHRMSSR